MDPNATLKSLREKCEEIFGWDAPESDAHEIAELVWSLDSWLTMGGFLPKRWDHPHRQPQPVEELT